MPRSKRNKVVSLTKTSAKGKPLKTKLVESLREAMDEYENVFVLRYDNMRAALFKEVRSDWRDSKIFLGKNTVAQVALGRTPETEFKDNLRHVSALLVGNSGLLFTNKPASAVTKYFKKFAAQDYAKAGAIPKKDIVLPAGDLDFPGNMLDQLRKLGMTVELDNGKISLKSMFIVASKDVPLTPEQAKLLVHMKVPLISFKISVAASWSDGEFSEAK